MPNRSPESVTSPTLRFETAAQLWQEGGYVFTTPTGRPINPSTDYHQWKRLLAAAGLRDGRLHDARHTADLGDNPFLSFAADSLIAYPTAGKSTSRKSVDFPAPLGPATT